MKPVLAWTAICIGVSGTWAKELVPTKPRAQAGVILNQDAPEVCWESRADPGLCLSALASPAHSTSTALPGSQAWTWLSRTKPVFPSHQTFPFIMFILWDSTTNLPCVQALRLKSTCVWFITPDQSTGHVAGGVQGLLESLQWPSGEWWGHRGALVNWDGPGPGNLIPLWDAVARPLSFGDIKDLSDYQEMSTSKLQNIHTARQCSESLLCSGHEPSFKQTWQQSKCAITHPWQGHNWRNTTGFGTQWQLPAHCERTSEWQKLRCGKSEITVNDKLWQQQYSWSLS